MSSERFKEGLETRQSVLGGEYVKSSLRSATEFTAEIQRLVTEYCWGEIWNRPELTKKERSLINIAMLTALNRPHELAAHIRGAINTGLSTQQIKGALLQTAIYCGVPAALDSFRVAQKTLQDLNIDLGQSPFEVPVA